MDCFQPIIAAWADAIPDWVANAFVGLVLGVPCFLLFMFRGKKVKQENDGDSE